MGIKWRMILMLGPFIILIFMAVTFFSQMGTRKMALDKANAEASLMALEEAPKVLTVINRAAADTGTLGECIVALHGNGAADRELMGNLLRSFLADNTEYQGVWVVWEPNAFDGKDADFVGHPYSGDDGSLAMYWYQGESGAIEVTGVNVRNETFYTIPKTSRNLTLVEPYIDPAAQPPVLMTTVAQPLMENGQVLGVFGIDIALDKLSTYIAQVKPYDTGYATLFSSAGTIVASADASAAGKGLDALAAENTPEVRSAIAEGRAFTRQTARGTDEYLTAFTPISIIAGAPSWSLEVALPLEQVMKEADQALTRTIQVSAIGILILLAGLLFVAQSLSSPLKRLAGYASTVAGGEYGASLDKRGFKGELVVLGQALSTMVSNLLEKMQEAERHKQEAEHETAIARQATAQAEEARQQSERSRREGMLQAAGQLEGIAAAISLASTELADRISQSEAGAAQQAAQATETASAMQEMNASVEEVARNAATASEVSLQTRQKADEGAGIVENAVASIQQVQRESLALKEDMAALSGQAQAISQIMNVISDIADQTNLLALNAAIEAARAGEAGRGFAVVADEVRKLAEKTMTSTTDVGRAIKAIQDSSTKSAGQVDHAVVTIEQATQFASQSGEALSRIVALADNSADQVRVIATASEQQSASSESINQSISQVNTIAGETARAMEEASRAVAELTSQAQSLMKLIDDMKRS